MYPRIDILRISAILTDTDRIRIEISLFERIRIRILCHGYSTDIILFYFLKFYSMSIVQCLRPRVISGNLQKTTMAKEKERSGFMSRSRQLYALQKKYREYGKFAAPEGRQKTNRLLASGGLCPPSPREQGLCPWTQVGLHPQWAQTPVIGSRSARSPWNPLSQT